MQLNSVVERQGFGLGRVRILNLVSVARFALKVDGDMEMLRMSEVKVFNSCNSKGDLILWASVQLKCGRTLSM